MNQRASNLVSKVVVVDDDAEHQRIVRRAVETTAHLFSPEDAPARIVVCADPATAMAHLQTDGICVVLCDYAMPAGSGLDWLPKFVHARVGPVLLMTSHGSERIAAKAFHSGAADYLVKSDFIEQPMMLAHAIAHAARRYRLEELNRELTGQLKQVTTDLARKNRRLSELSDAAHGFVDDVAHDFRTPLTVVQEYAAIIADELDGPVNDKQRQHLNVIMAAAREMSHMVDDFLDSTRLRVGTVRTDRQSHRVADLIDRAIQMLTLQARSRQVTLETRIAPDVNPVYADGEKIRRVLINLASNAIKVSPPGSTVCLAAEPDACGDVRVSVIDAGPGLDEAQRDRIFERFHQGDAEGEHEPHGARGLGLGLSIVQQLVQLNLGRVALVSRRGEGSTFSITLSADEPSRILHNFLHSRLHADDSAELGAIRFGAADENEFESLHRLLAHTGASSELILAHPSHRSVLVIGRWPSTAARAEELNQTIEASRRSRGQSGASVRLNILGSWPLNESHRALHAQLTAAIEWSTDHASVHTAH
ncbi:MAG: response regulator [Planctomycetes bacterium]|nr:response regulator [Planctomycetota bacterium]